MYDTHTFEAIAQVYREERMREAAAIRTATTPPGPAHKRGRFWSIAERFGDVVDLLTDDDLPFAPKGIG